MATITVRNLEDRLKTRLRVRAAHNGRSMEEEARQILQAALLQDESNESLASIMHRLFGAAGGIDLPAQKQEPLRQPPSFD